MNFACRAVLWGLLALFALTVVANVANCPLDADTTQIDEQAHLSYAQYLIQKDSWWPDFDHFPMYDTTTGKTLTITNYLNHPPTFYWLARLAHDAFPGLTTADYRNGALAITLLGIALYGLIGQRMAMKLLPTAAYAAMPWMLYVHKQVGFYNNDCIAILGGLLASYGSLHWFRGKRGAFWMLLAGVVLASVKLTALMLVGLYAAACVLDNRSMLRSISWKSWAFATIILTLCALPFVQLMLQYGSPAPETLGQQLLMTHHPAGDHWTRKLIVGWVQEPHMDFLHWLAHFLRDFTVQVAAYDMTFLPLLLIAILALRAMLHRVRLDTPTAPMLRAGAIATGLTFLVHTAFSWGRYQHYGWQLDAGLRYYFPLLAIYGIAAASALKKETL